MPDKQTIIYLYLVTLIALICGCKSGTGEIATSATEIRKSSQMSIDAANEIVVSAEATQKHAASIVAETVAPKPNIDTIRMTAEVVVLEQVKIIGHADRVLGEQVTVQKEVGDVTTALTTVQDVVPWWGKILTYGLFAAASVCVAWMLWYTGVGGFIRGVLGIITPRAKSEAEIAVAALNEDDPTTTREMIASRRGSDPEFDRAFRKVKDRVTKEGAQRAAVVPLQDPAVTKEPI